MVGLEPFGHLCLALGGAALRFVGSEGLYAAEDLGLHFPRVGHEEKVEAAPVVEEGVEAAAVAPAEPEVIKKERAEKPEPEK